MTKTENLPDGCLDRLAQFAAWTGTTPPARLLDDDRAFSTEFIAYVVENGASLDWLILGDVGPLVMRAHNAALKAAA